MFGLVFIVEMLINPYSYHIYFPKKDHFLNEALSYVAYICAMWFQKEVAEGRASPGAGTRPGGPPAAAVPQGMPPPVAAQQPQQPQHLTPQQQQKDLLQKLLVAQQQNLQQQIHQQLQHQQAKLKQQQQQVSYWLPSNRTCSCSISRLN